MQRCVPPGKTIGAGETVAIILDFDTGIRTAKQPKGIGVLVSDLVGLGSVVAQGKSITQPFFSVDGEETIIEGETVQVFTYASPEAAKADADLVSPLGSPIGTSMVSWVSAPHFYLKDTLLVLYVGLNVGVIERLETVMGPEFAGVDPTSSFALPVPATGPAAKVEEYLELMDKLSQALRSVVRSTDQEAAVAQVLTVATRLKEYVDFFASLYEQERKELIAPYAELISETAVTASKCAREAMEATGDESIGLPLQRTPVFMAATMQISGPIERIVVMEKVGGNNAGAYLSLKEVSAAAGGINLKIEYRDLKAKASAVDPAQVEHMESFAVLSFDSEEAAATHMALMTGPDSGMHDMDETIGDASVSLEANQGGMGSVVAFKKGEWVVSLHNSHPNGDTPLMDRAALESLARVVTGRL